MDKSTYRITQDNSLLRPGETPISTDDLEFHLRYLPDELTRFFADNGIHVEVEHSNRDVRISMPEEVDGQKSAVMLSDFLGALNMKKMGLAFGMELYD